MKPSRTLLFSLLLWVVCAGLASFLPDWLLYWQLLGMGLFALLGFDAVLTRFLPTPRVQRVCAASLPLGEWHEVSLNTFNAGNSAQTFTVFDDYPQPAEIQGQPQQVRIPARSGAKIQYRLRPQRRGAAQFSGLYLHLKSPLGLWQQCRYLPLVTEVKIYPNFATVSKYILLATANRLGQFGIRQLRRRGEGLEFHQLREYRAGDSLRQISWNATSRLKKLISKEYQDERDQQLIFLLDSGRRMLAQDGEISHFDHTLNAILLLTYVALRQGDAVGLSSFSGELRWLAPRKGARTLNVMLNTLYDLQPSLQSSDYLTAARHLMARHPKRSLVVIVSNFRDEDNDELLAAVRLLRQKHLVLLASLQERVLNEVLNESVENFDSALRYAATQTYLQQRRLAHQALQTYGVLLIDAEPEKLPVMMVNKYLEVKREGRL